MSQVCIEIPQGSKIKYEKIHAPDGSKMAPGFKIDRIIDNRYPAPYGYLVGQMAEDGDEKDVFVISEDEFYYTGKIFDTKDYSVLAEVQMIDSGDKDNKLIFSKSGISKKYL